MEKLDKNARYLGVSADYLLGLETRKPETFLESFDAMPPEDKKRFLADAALRVNGMDAGAGGVVVMSIAPRGGGEPRLLIID
jgi:hypothetical protein